MSANEEVVVAEVVKETKKRGPQHCQFCTNHAEDLRKMGKERSLKAGEFDI